jgi:hypothetical protein
MKSTILRTTVISLFGIIFSGCASGQQFSAFKQSVNEEGKSGVYFYRPDRFIGQAVPYAIFRQKIATDQNESLNMWGTVTVATVKNNSFAYKELKPNIYQFGSNHFKTFAEIKLLPNEIKCIKLTTQLFNLNDVEEIEKNLCLQEIKETREMTKEDEESIW